MRWAAANITELGRDAGRLGLAGDSAGANLAAAVAQAGRAGGPRLAAQLLIYPAVDAAGHYRAEAENAKYPSRAQKADGYFLTLDTMRGSLIITCATIATDSIPSPRRSSPH